MKKRTQYTCHRCPFRFINIRLGYYHRYIFFLILILLLHYSCSYCNCAIHLGSTLPKSRLSRTCAPFNFLFSSSYMLYLNLILSHCLGCETVHIVLVCSHFVCHRRFCFYFLLFFFFFLLPRFSPISPPISLYGKQNTRNRNLVVMVMAAATCPEAGDDNIAVRSA